MSTIVDEKLISFKEFIMGQFYLTINNKQKDAAASMIYSIINATAPNINNIQFCSP